MDRSKRKVQGKKLLSVMLAALTIGSTVVTTGSLTGVGISASAVSYTEEISASGFKYEQYGETITITGYNGSDTELVIPSEIDGKTVTRIKQFAFYDCTVLTSVTIPNSVTKIGEGAFRNCTGLKSIAIGNGVTSIGGGAFDGCTGLTNIKVSDNNPIYSSQDGVLFNKDKTKIIICLCGKSGTYKIPDSVTKIGNSAFSGCTELTSVIIPDSVTEIDGYAFYGCTGLTSVKIPDSVTSIGGSAFSGCTGLTDITIPDSVTEIDWGAFDDTAWYNNQPDGVVYVGKVAYTYKGEMPESTNITLKNGTKGIADYAFDDCGKLTSITIPDGVTSIGKYAFFDCVSLKNITIPDSVAEIGYEAFVNTGWYYNQPSGVVYAGNVVYDYKGQMPENTNITLKNGTKGITDSAFRDCTGLTSIIIPDSVTYIGSSAFRDCTGLTSVIIGNGVISIGVWAFDGCAGLTSITIPDSVTEIGGGAFGRCTGLTNITIPDSVTEIGSGAFDYCTRLTSITISSDNTNYSSQEGVWFNKDKTKLIQYPCGKTGIYTIPDSVISIGDSAFDGCTGLTSVTIPDSVTSIGNRAFSDCTGITSITIPDSVTEIGDSAFGYYWYYYYDDDDPGSGFSDYMLIDDFTIYGVKGSAAEIYADKNWIQFVSVEPEYTTGDVNNDGNVNIADALLIARYDASLEVLDETQQKAGDVTGEGEVNIADALLIARYDAGLIDTL